MSGFPKTLGFDDEFYDGGAVTQCFEQIMWRPAPGYAALMYKCDGEWLLTVRELSPHVKIGPMVLFTKSNSTRDVVVTNTVQAVAVAMYLAENFVAEPYGVVPIGGVV